MKYLWLIFIPSLSFASCRVADALMTLTPGAQWVMTDDTYSKLTWLDKVQTQPTPAQVIQAISDCQQSELAIRQQIQNDVYNVQLATNTIAQKFPALIDLLKQRGLLQ